MKQLLSLFAVAAITAIATMYFTVNAMEPDVIVKTITVTEYRDTCDSHFFKVIAELESGAVTLSKNDSCYLFKPISGDGDMGKGHLGIYNVCIEGTRLDKILGYTHDDMFDLKKGFHVFWSMMGIFAHTYYAKYGTSPTYEELARMWAGGPDGYKKEATDKYAAKFLKVWSTL